VSDARSSGIGRRLVVGAVAGTAGTAAMDLLLYLRYRREGGKESGRRWEFSAGTTDWDTASAPGQLGMKVEGIVIGHPPPDGWARPTTNLVHWATGIGWGILYGALTGTRSTHPLVRALAFGPVVWLAGYVILPLAKVYEPIWKYDARTLGKDLSVHVVYGVASSATFAALDRVASG
jgi:hypothetical protein